MEVIKPISSAQKRHVVGKTEEFIHQASDLYQYRFKLIPISFDLKGRIAGMYRVRGRTREIRFNPYLFAKYYQDNLEVTVPHEVAHYIADMLFGLRNIQPHGPEWKGIMHSFGADASRTCRYDLEGIPTRQERRFTYACLCRTHLLTARRHNRIHRGAGYYLCNQCGERLKRQ